MSRSQTSRSAPEPQVLAAPLAGKGAITVVSRKGDYYDKHLPGRVAFVNCTELRAERVTVDVLLRGSPGATGDAARPAVGAVHVEGIEQGLTFAQWWRAAPARDLEVSAIEALTIRHFADPARPPVSVYEIPEDGSGGRALDPDRTKKRIRRAGPVDYAKVLRLAEQTPPGRRPGPYIAEMMDCTPTTARKWLERARKAAT